MTAVLHLKMIIWTSVLALGLGAVATLTMLEPPPGLVQQSNIESAPVVRGPASADTASKFTAVSLDVTNQHQAVDLAFNLSFGCTPLTTTTFARGVRQLRLNAESCVKGQSVKEATVVNLTNNFSATTFMTSPHAFTTDYISLAEGDNRLRIIQTYEDGSHSEHELRISRAPASQKE